MRHLSSYVRRTTDELLQESMDSTSSKLLAQRLLKRLKPEIAAFSFVTGSSLLIRHLERLLIQQIGRMYNRQLSSHRADEIRSKIEVRSQERWSWFLESTFFVPAIGNLIKAAFGAQLVQSIGAEIIRSFEKRNPHCRWQGERRNDFRKFSA